MPIIKSLGGRDLSMFPGRNLLPRLNVLDSARGSIGHLPNPRSGLRVSTV